MKSNMWKSTFREIKQSFGRFMAIFAIIALGVSLFSGLKVLQSAMVKTTDGYLKEKQFYNYRLVSTMGFEEEDVAYLAAQEDVRAIEGAVSFDILCNSGDKNNIVLKAYNLPKQINDIELLAGNLPQTPQECVVDSTVFGEAQIGQKIYLSEENEEDDLENFSYEEYTISGIVQSPNYIQTERGNTSLGNGKITGFVYMPLESFDVDFFTEILLKFDEDYVIFSEAYDTYMDEKEAVWENLTQTAADSRYDRIVGEAEEELADAKQEFAEEKAKAEKELEDARIELADAKKELKDADQKIADAKQEIADGKQEIADGREEITKNVRKLQKAEKEIADGEEELEKGQSELDANRTLIEEQKAQVAEGKVQLEAGQVQLNDQKALLEAAKQSLEQAETGIVTIRQQWDTYKPMLGYMTPEQQESFFVPLEQGLDTLLAGLIQGQSEESGDDAEVSAE